MIDNDYLPSSNVVLKHKSMKRTVTNIERGDDQITTLDKCLSNYFKTEKLGDKRECSTCETLQAHDKKTCVFRLPPIITV